MDKRIGLAVVTGDEAEALHAVEELDRAGGALAGQLALRRLFLGHGDNIANRFEVACRDLAAAINQVELKLLALSQAFQPGALNRADVDEHVLTPAIALNEAEAFVCIEEFYRAGSFTNDLGRHSAAATAARSAAAEAAAITAAEARPIAAETAAAATTAAESVTAAAAKPVATATTCERIKAFLRETIPLVAPTAATPSIETHKLELTFASPHSTHPEARTNRTGRQGKRALRPLLCRVADRPIYPQVRIEFGGAAILPGREPASVTFLQAGLPSCLPGAGLAGGRRRSALPMFRQLSEYVFASPQIGLDEVVEAAVQGITLIVNNRPEDESDDQTPGAAIEAAARASGLGYVAIPVTHAGFSETQIEAMAKALAASKGPVLAYCRSGTRSTLLWALAEASRGADPAGLTAAAANAGYDLGPIRTLLDMLASRGAQ